MGEAIRAIDEDSRGTYGMPRVHAELVARGWRVSRKRVARLMREAGLAGVSRRRGVRTTCANSSHRAAPDRVERRFQADAPDRLWVADITYVPTWAGFLYLAVVLDVFSRRIVGWSMAHHLRTERVLNALNMALAQRRPEQVIHHSDQGAQYTSLAFGLGAALAGQMGSVVVAMVGVELARDGLPHELQRHPPRFGLDRLEVVNSALADQALGFGAELRGERRFKPPFFSGAPDPPASNCASHKRVLTSTNSRVRR